MVMTATIVHAKSLADRGEARGAEALADTFCRQSRRRIARSFRSLFHNDDLSTAKAAKRFLGGEFEWLEEGVISVQSYHEQVARARAGSEAADETPSVPTPEPVPTS
jgi:hypothetical protein